MYVSELFVVGECIIDSLAGPGKKLGVLGGDDLKNNNDDLKRPNNNNNNDRLTAFDPGQPG